MDRRDFSIIKTIDDGQSSISTIPSEWIIEGNRVYWPSSGNVDRLRRKVGVKPGGNGWTIHKCVVLRHGIPSIDVGIKMEKKLVKHATSSEDEYLNKPSTAGKPPQVNVNKTIEALTEKKSGSENSSSDSDSSGEETSNSASDKEEELAPAPTTSCQDCKKCDENHELLLKLNVKVDELLEKVEILQKTTISSDGDKQLDDFTFPLEEKEELFKLDLVLSDARKREIFINQFKSVGGTRGEQNGEKIADILIDKLISRRIPTFFTWTGKSSAKNGNKKEEFRLLTNFLESFSKIVLIGDKQFSELQVQKFFVQKVLKHAEERFQRKK
ncbi:hypothetical protein DMENIID0001_098180 [Sergentomyia squamirostris]